MRVVLAVCLLVCCVSCSVAGFTARSTQYNITVQLDTVGIGKRPLTVMLQDRTDNPITDATITVTPLMPQHGMLGIPTQLQAGDPGVYTVAELELSMSGEWQLQFDIVRAGTREQIMLPVVIE